MTDKQLVLSIYPEAKCIPWAENHSHRIIQAKIGWLAVDESEKLAWSQAANGIREWMLEKLVEQ